MKPAKIVRKKKHDEDDHDAEIDIEKRIVAVGVLRMRRDLGGTLLAEDLGEESSKVVEQQR